MQHPCSMCKAEAASCSKNKMAEGLLTVVVSNTERCNKRCPYCWHFNRIGKDRLLSDMGPEHADRFLDLVERQFPGYQIIYVVLGGEPTLNIPFVDYLLSETIRRRQHYFCSLITNGKSKLGEVAELMNKYKNVQTQVSLMTNTDKTEASVLQYIRMQNAYYVIFSIVIGENELDSLPDILRHYKRLGVRKLFINFEFQACGFSIQDRDSYRKKLVHAYRIYQDELKDFNFKIENLDALNHPREVVQNVLSGPGAPVSMERHTFDYFADQNFYASHFVNSEPLGNTIDGIDMDKLKQMSKFKNCEGCKYTRLCFANRSIFVMPDLSYEVQPDVCLPHQITADFIVEELGVDWP